MAVDIRSRSANEALMHNLFDKCGIQLKLPKEATNDAGGLKGMAFLNNDAGGLKGMAFLNNAQKTELLKAICKDNTRRDNPFSRLAVLDGWQASVSLTEKMLFLTALRLSSLAPRLPSCPKTSPSIPGLRAGSLPLFLPIGSLSA